MYGYKWTDKNGIFQLSPSVNIAKEIRPVFKQELDYFGLDAYWSYPDTSQPMLWAEGIQRYVLNGELVAEAKGGGFYTKPTVEIAEGKENLKLKPINLTALWKENHDLMLGLEKKAIDFIREVHGEYKVRGMAFVCAFSGGKDSLVLLDLVRRALAPREFYVIFSDTGMELSSTYESVRRAKEHYPELRSRFHTARSHMSAEESWDLFGPPGRRMRWCCAVHKSVPTILKLRELLTKDGVSDAYTARVVVFDGIRAEESTARSGYDLISDGAKNINQVNCSPILKWGTAEVFLYLLKRNLLFNDAYRLGLFRVGCTVCPMSSEWWDGIANNIYSIELSSLLSRVEKYAENKPEKERTAYIESGGWKGRMGGRGLPNGGNRYMETIIDDTISFSFSQTTQNWIDICTLLGEVIKSNEDTYTQIINHRSYVFRVRHNNVSYYPYSIMDRYVISHLRGIANKVAYCGGCKACEVECPANALAITINGKIFIREERCVHCANCINFCEKGCLVAKSLRITGGNSVNLKGMNRYNHFGFRRPWLDHFFEFGVDCFSMQDLGTYQYTTLKTWLKEAEFLTPTGKGDKSGVSTQLCEKLKSLGAGNPLVWAIIWTNLAYNSIIARWYMQNVPPGNSYDKGELVFMLGDDYSQSTRDNAVVALLETFRESPIGTVLKQGVPIPIGNNTKYAKQGWGSPDAVAILYALYRYAEATEDYRPTLTRFSEIRNNFEAKGVDPVAIFALDPETFKEMLQSIALQYDAFIRVTFVKDLDNITLNPEKTTLDIARLIGE